MVSLVRRRVPDLPIKIIGDMAYSILELGWCCATHRITLIAPFRLDAVIHQISEKRTSSTLGCSVWSGSACHLSSRSCMILRLRGSASRWTGMEKENKRWRSAPPRLCGIVLYVPFCRFAGFLPVILAGNVLQRPSFQRIRHKLLSRLSWIL